MLIYQTPILVTNCFPHEHPPPRTHTRTHAHIEFVSFARAPSWRLWQKRFLCRVIYRGCGPNLVSYYYWACRSCQLIPFKAQKKYVFRLSSCYDIDDAAQFLQSQFHIPIWSVHSKKNLVCILWTCLFNFYYLNYDLIESYKAQVAIYVNFRANWFRTHCFVFTGIRGLNFSLLDRVHSLTQAAI